jgi:heat shock protein 4
LSSYIDCGSITHTLIYILSALLLLVIAIPNYFTDAQRRAFLDGCEIVGITGVQRLMHENTATALAYGIFKDLKKEFTADKPTNVMFIDMGASAYSVSIVAFEPGKFTVISAYCDPDLGGRDFDMAVANWLAEQFETKHKGKLSGKPMDQAKVRIKLLAAAEKAKKTLSPQGVAEARVNLEMLMDDFDFSVALKALDYEKMCEPLLAKLEGPIEKALAEAKLTAKDLDSVEIVGGSTRIGCLKRKLEGILGVGLSTTMNADESVARGAALQSAILSPRFKVLPYDIHEAQPYPIKICWDEDGASGMEVDAATGVESPTNSVVMFTRGLSFPIVRRVTLKRAGDFTVKSSYDESSLQYGLASTEHIAEFKIKAAPGEEKKVRINVKQDIHGIVQLSSAQMVEEIDEDEAVVPDETKADADAVEKKKKIKKTNLEFTVSRPLSFTKEEINKAHECEVQMANNDRVIQETADKRNELESYIYGMRDKIASDVELGQYASMDEKGAFVDAIEKMENWLYEEGFDATKSVYAEKLADLKKIGDPIERRAIEGSARASTVAQLQANLEQYQKWINESQADERYSHISDEDREKVRAMCDSTSAWMYEMLDKQGDKPLHEDPVLTVADLKSRNQEMTKTCSPIMNKPKPAPKKEEPEKEDPPAGDQAPAAEATPMEGVETETGEKMEEG